MKTLNSSTGNNSEEQLTLFAGGSLAKTSVKPVGRQDLAANEARYIPKCLELLASVCRDTQFLKTSQGYLLASKEDGLHNFSITWPRSGTMLNGTVFQPPTLAPPITEIGSGLLPTPVATMEMQARMRKVENNGANKHSLTLPKALKMLPTPKTSDAKGASKSRTTYNNKSNLCEVLRVSTADSIYPNPRFVEQMMGFPVGHTDLGSLETQ